MEQASVAMSSLSDSTGAFISITIQQPQSLYKELFHVSFH